MTSPTQWTWVLVNSGSWWWTGRPGMLWFMGLQRVRHYWATELNWTEYSIIYTCITSSLFYFMYFSWRLITLQYCSGFCHTLIWISHGFTCVPHLEPLSHLPSHPIPLGHPSAPVLSTLSHALNLDWRSVPHMIIYMFQCYSLRSSHPCLLPQSPIDCSIHLCLFCCLTYRVIITIVPNSIYMHKYTVLVFFFLTKFGLYNRLQFHPPH